MELQRWNEVFAERGRKFLVSKPRLRRLLGLSIIPLSLLLAILKPHFLFQFSKGTKVFSALPVAPPAPQPPPLQPAKPNLVLPLGLSLSHPQ